MNPSTPLQTGCPESTHALRQQLHERVDRIADFCEQYNHRFATFEKELKELVWQLGRLFIALFLLARQQRCDKPDRRFPGYWRMPDLAYRTLRTLFGAVRYGRSYWARRHGGSGFHPLDAELGLTRDGFSPWVISLACRLSSYLSYAKTTLLFEAFWGWSPSTETVEQWVLGVARQAPAYMAAGPPLPEPDGEVLVIEVDGKAVPTATDEELQKRRCSQRQRRCSDRCKCQRHRGRQARRARGSKKRRKKGDKSKNGRSATLVAVYTLRRGVDGKLHGPINKRLWGSFAPRRIMIRWVRAEATRRGFGPDTDKQIQIIVDGDRCLAKRLGELFPKAILTLDIRHVEERLWNAGCAFHAEGSPELAAWVNDLRAVLYEQGGATLTSKLQQLRQQIAGSSSRSQRQRKALDSLLKYLTPRQPMMDYAKYLAEDLVIASGVIEGACRYVIGERMDCSGMRWVEGKAEAILYLRCLEVNGLWEPFFDWCCERWAAKLDRREAVQIRTDQPLKQPEAA